MNDKGKEKAKESEKQKDIEKQNNKNKQKEEKERTAKAAWKLKVKCQQMTAEIKKKEKEEMQKEKEKRTSFPIFEVQHKFIYLHTGLRASHVTLNRGQILEEDARIEDQPGSPSPIVRSQRAKGQRVAHGSAPKCQCKVPAFLQAIDAAVSAAEPQTSEPRTLMAAWSPRLPMKVQPQPRLSGTCSTCTGCRVGFPACLIKAHRHQQPRRQMKLCSPPRLMKNWPTHWLK